MRSRDVYVVAALVVVVLVAVALVANWREARVERERFEVDQAQKAADAERARRELESPAERRKREDAERR